MVILYVDDDPEDIEIFDEAVKECNPSINCVVAQNGKKAMDILHSDVLPDYIFLDINMPVINGKSLLLEIRREKKFKDIPVIMYSTSISKTDMEEYKKMGANHFLIKHNRFQDLCDAVNEIILRR